MLESIGITKVEIIGDCLITTFSDGSISARQYIGPVPRLGQTITAALRDQERDS